MVTFYAYALTANFTGPVKYTWSVSWLSFGGLWVSLTGHCVESACTSSLCTHSTQYCNEFIATNDL